MILKHCSMYIPRHIDGFCVFEGYFCMQAISNYKKSVVIMMTSAATGSGGFYDSDKETMKLGYSLAQYGAYVAFATCFLVLVNCGLYIPYGEGKWIWQKKVAPAEGAKASIVKTQ